MSLTCPGRVHRRVILDNFLTRTPRTCDTKMLHNVGGVWYERIYSKNYQDDVQKVKSFATLFQGPVVVEKKVIAVL